MRARHEKCRALASAALRSQLLTDSVSFVQFVCRVVANSVSSVSRKKGFLFFAQCNVIFWATTTKSSSAQMWTSVWLKDFEGQKLCTTTIQSPVQGLDNFFGSKPSNDCFDLMATSKVPPKFGDTSWTPCQLSSDNCLTLQKITSNFSAPITEEHAWAIVFECVKCLQSVVDGKSRVFAVTNTRQILLHHDGHIHAATFQCTGVEESSSTSGRWSLQSTHFFCLS